MSKSVGEVLCVLTSITSIIAVHRDLRPENLLLQKISDGSLTLKISDFGICRRVSSGTLLTADHRGDSDWTAYEVARAKKDKKRVRYVCQYPNLSFIHYGFFLLRLELSTSSLWDV